jgi:hypothetical protein
VASGTSSSQRQGPLEANRTTETYGLGYGNNTAIDGRPLCCILRGFEAAFLWLARFFMGPRNPNFQCADEAVLNADEAVLNPDEAVLNPDEAVEALKL